jgi:hypothetical protein
MAANDTTLDSEKDPFDAIVDAPFDSALSERYLVYALSTITARSLPTGSSSSTLPAASRNRRAWSAR